jgi:hypothetical protein
MPKTPIKTPAIRNIASSTLRDLGLGRKRGGPLRRLLMACDGTGRVLWDAITTGAAPERILALSERLRSATERLVRAYAAHPTAKDSLAETLRVMRAVDVSDVIIDGACRMKLGRFTLLRIRHIRCRVVALLFPLCERPAAMVPGWREQVAREPATPFDGGRWISNSLYGLKLAA